jgi:hypothetical protein
MPSSSVHLMAGSRQLAVRRNEASRFLEAPEWDSLLAPRLIAITRLQSKHSAAAGDRGATKRCDGAPEGVPSALAKVINAHAIGILCGSSLVDV